MKIKILKACIIKGTPAAEGEELELDTATARELIAIGRAAPAEKKPAAKKKTKAENAEK